MLPQTTKRRSDRELSFFLFLLCCFVLAFLGTAYRPAAAQMALEISPIRVEHQIQAGMSETNVVEVWNSGQKPVRVRTSLQDWTMDQQGNLKFSRAGGKPQSLAPWLEINPTDFQVGPGERKQIRYTMNVPASARPGSYWVALMVEGMPPQVGPPVPKKVALHGRFAVCIYNSVGSREIRGSFKDFQVHTRQGRPTLLISLANQGQYHFRPQKSKVTIRNQQGQQVASVDVPDAPVLPGLTRDIKWEPEIKLAPGQYQAEARLDIGRREMLVRQVAFTVGR